MSLSMYQASVPVFLHMLGTLRNLLEKGAAHAEARKFEPSALIQARLFPDMLPLARQIQIASDAAKGCGARLAGVEVPKFADTESSFAELIDRIDKTVAFLKELTPAQVDGSEGKTVVLPMRSGDLTFTGQQFLLGFALPNFFFHVTTAYNLLRHNGVEIGKMDFLGRK